jgi:hypothetical protein
MARRNDENDEVNWTRLLKGEFLYSFANHGQLIIAIDQSKPTNAVFFTTTYGAQWSKIKLTENNEEFYYFANDLLKRQVNDDEDDLTRFLLFATNSKTGQPAVFELTSKMTDTQSIKSIMATGMSVTLQTADSKKCNKSCVSIANKLVEICLDSSSVCNGVSECADESDELNCDVDSLLKTVYNLSKMRVRIGQNSVVEYEIGYSPILLVTSHFSDQLKFNAIVGRLMQAVEDTTSSAGTHTYQEETSQVMEGVFRFKEFESEETLSCIAKIFVNVTVYSDESKHFSSNKLITLGEVDLSGAVSQGADRSDWQRMSVDRVQLVQVGLIFLVCLVVSLLVVLTVVMAVDVHSRCRRVRGVSPAESSGSSNKSGLNSKIYKPLASNEFFSTSTGLKNKERCESKQNLIENDFNNVV